LTRTSYLIQQMARCQYYLSWKFYMVGGDQHVWYRL